MNSIDIAKIAGVSRSTVSRVINNYNNVPEETKKKVLDVIKKYNYVPHASAQMLAGKKNKTLGLFIIDTKSADIENKMTASSYFSPFTSAIVDIANKRQYNVLVSLIGTPRDFGSMKDIFYNKTICGGIFIGGRNYEQEIMDLIDRGYRTAVIGQEVREGNDLFRKSIVVNTDSFGGAYMAVRHLIDLGHREIAHISGDMSQYTAVEKLEGYKRALKDAHLDIKDSLINKGDYTENSGYAAARELLTTASPTAIFAANDSMAIGAYRAINEAGLKIPEDISVIGFDNIEIAKYLQPPLTTVSTSVFQVVSAAVDNLIRSNEEDMDISACYRIPVELIARDSCRRRF